MFRTCSVSIPENYVSKILDFLFFSIYLSLSVSNLSYLSVYVIYLSLSISVCLSIYPSIYIYLPTYLPAYLPTYLSSVYLVFSLTSFYILAVAVQGHCYTDHIRWHAHNPYDSSEWGIGPSQRPLLDNTTDSHPYRRQDSNPLSHQPSCRRPSPYAAWPLVSVKTSFILNCRTWWPE